MGFSGLDCQPHWDAAYAAVVVSAPQTGKQAGLVHSRGGRWIAGIRQPIESVNGRLLLVCGLERERPHADGAASWRGWRPRSGLHNVCAWLNRTHGRGLLCFADLVDW